MNVRELVYQSLNNIIIDKAFSNLEVNKTLKENELSILDVSLYTNIVYGVLQNNILLNHIVASYTNKHKVSGRIKTLLKMSYYQMYYMDKLPFYAVINESVEIAKKEQGQSAANFVNAVLHSMMKKEYSLEQSAYKDVDEYNALLYSIPLWLYKMVSKHYGSNACLAWAKSSKVVPPTFIRVNEIKATKEEILKNPDFSELDNTLVYVGKGNAANTVEYKEGKIVIQDASAQKVAILLDLKEEDKVLDMCAAPGAKTTHMASLMHNKGEIVAVDLYESRVNLIRNAIHRLGVKNIKTCIKDSLSLLDDYKEESFDKILLDAPCSGFGVIRRKPDILLNYEKDSKGLDELIPLQASLLEVAYKLLKKNGLLVYSTCTLNKKENEKQVSEFIKKHENVKIISEEVVLPTEKSGDGFYMAKLIKE